MGLDITAYERVEFVAPASDEAQMEAYYDEKLGEDVIALYASFAERMDGLQEGVYRASGRTISLAAGSYSGYNQWRKLLAHMLNTSPEAIWNNPRPGPFVELINFSDCEGTIGPKTSAKLAADFREWQDRAAEFAQTLWKDGDWWLTKYNKWREAFELAAGSGAVQFH